MNRLNILLHIISLIKKKPGVTISLLLALYLGSQAPEVLEVLDQYKELVDDHAAAMH